MFVTPLQFGATPEKQMTGTLDINTVVVVRLPRPMEGNGVTQIFRSLQICQFHHRRLESLEHFYVLYMYIYIYNSEHYGLPFLDFTDAISFFTRSPFFVYIFFASTLCICVMYLTSI